MINLKINFGKFLLLISIILFNISCTSIKGHVNLTSSSDENNTFQNIESDWHAILDGILSSSSNNTQLSLKENKLLEQFVSKTQIFCHKKFNNKWLKQLNNNLLYLEKNEKNKIAIPLQNKIRHLFSQRECKRAKIVI